MLYRLVHKVTTSQCNLEKEKNPSQRKAINLSQYRLVPLLPLHLPAGCGAAQLGAELISVENWKCTLPPTPSLTETGRRVLLSLPSSYRQTARCNLARRRLGDHWGTQNYGLGHFILWTIIRCTLPLWIWITFWLFLNLVGIISRKAVGNTAQWSVYPVEKHICTFHKVTERSLII